MSCKAYFKSEIDHQAASLPTESKWSSNASQSPQIKFEFLPIKCLELSTFFASQPTVCHFWNVADMESLPLFHEKVKHLGKDFWWHLQDRPWRGTQSWCLVNMCWMALREDVFLICDGSKVISLLAGQASSLFSSAVGLVSVMSGRKKNDRQHQGGTQNSWKTQVKWRLGNGAFVLGGEDLFALGDWGNESYFNNIIQQLYMLSARSIARRTPPRDHHLQHAKVKPEVWTNSPLCSAEDKTT